VVAQKSLDKLFYYRAQSQNYKTKQAMQVPRNNWTIIGTTLGLWLFSWLFVYTQHWPIGDREFYIWTTGKALLPLVAILCMYVLAVRTAATRGRSKLILHLTYMIVLLLSANSLHVGWKDSVEWDDTAVDWSCVFVLTIGGIIFWFFRGIEIVIRRIRNSKSAS
jgi:hypothetical protein